MVIKAIYVQNSGINQYASIKRQTDALKMLNDQSTKISNENLIRTLSKNKLSNSEIETLLNIIKKHKSHRYNSNELILDFNNLYADNYLTYKLMMRTIVELLNNFN